MGMHVVIIGNPLDEFKVYGSFNTYDHALGGRTVARASYVEPDQHGRWFADLSPVGGTTLGSFLHRSDALAAE